MKNLFIVDIQIRVNYYSAILLLNKMYDIFKKIIYNMFSSKKQKKERMMQK